MADFQAIADRVEIAALQAEFTDAAMMSDYDRVASLFTLDGVMRWPHAGAEFAGREVIRAIGPRRDAVVDLFVQNTHPGVIHLEGDTASGRVYVQEIIHLRDGSSHQNHALYHDRYQRTAEGWKFAERVYEVRYLDNTPLGGSAPAPTPAPESAPESAGSATTRP